MAARGEDPAWLFWLSLVGLLALIGGVIAAAPMIAKLAPAPPSPEVRVEKMLLEDGESGDVYRTVKRTFPEDFSQIVMVAANALRQGTPEPMLAPVIRQALAQAEARHRAQLMQAPHDPLAAFRAAEIRLVQYFHEKDPELCARYVATGRVTITDRTDLSTDALDDMRIAAWEAYAAGRDKPAGRVIREPDMSVWRTIAKSMQSEGVSEAEVDALLSGRGFAMLPEMAQCQTGIEFFRAIQKLPPDRSDAVSAFLLSRNGTE
ncbi:hypothetical protein [Sphingomonas sp.]|uniref:hypothetical protein n=1 Tax=Sphingomonas sp. TaxID=28214 RepID=UPI001B0D8BF4|nr:hypothetical protein [Sphingomonas sp.]MBO9711366.1 hypothetical protein [Sphingomonas sp.]